MVLGQIVEKRLTMSAGEQTALEMDLPIDGKSAEKIWKNYMKPFGKLDWDRRNKEHVLFEKKVSAISDDPITIVSKFSNVGNESKGAFWIKDDDSFLDAENNPEKVRSAAEFLQGFYHETERHGIREEIKGQEGTLKGMAKELKKLEKNNEKLHKEINKAKEEIAKKEAQIEENLGAQQAKSSEMEAQQAKIKETTLKLANVGKGGS